MQQQETKKTRRIRQVSVTNLFGIFNHVIPLKMDEHITIIHGPNGFGKTMIFRLLRTLFGQSTHLLQKIPFDEIRIDFEDDTSFWVSKTLRSALTGDEQPIEYEVVFHATGRSPYTVPSQTLQMENSLDLSRIDRIITTLDRIGPDAWLDMLSGETLSLEDVMERFGDRLPAGFLITRTVMPDWLVNIRKSVPIEFGSEKKIDEIFESTKKDVRTLLLECGVTIGYLRWVSLRENLALKFEDLEFTQFLKKDALHIEQLRCIQVVKNKSQRHNITDTQIDAYIQDLRDDAHDPWHVCCGHDLVSILSTGLRKIIGTWDPKDVRPENLERCFRLAFDRSYFYKTQLYLSIQQWEQTNMPFVILASE